MPSPARTCLVVDDMHESFVPLLEAAGLQVSYQPGITSAQVEELLPGYEVLVVRSKVRVDARLLARAQRLKLVARAGAGVDNVDEEALAWADVALVNAPEGNRRAVGEHTLGMLLCGLRHLHTADREVRQKVWLREENRGRELGSLTVGIIGYGNTGQSFARCLSGFGCPVLAYDKYQPDFSDDFAKPATLPELFERAQVLSFHVPLTPETRQLADRTFLSRFRHPLVLLNTSRGEVVNQTDLVMLLQEGKILFAALDVLENEHLRSLTRQQESDFHYLAAASNVLLTPHIAGWTVESYSGISKILAQKITRFMNIS